METKIFFSMVSFTRAVHSYLDYTYILYTWSIIVVTDVVYVGTGFLV